jgi:hypothetical protein
MSKRKGFMSFDKIIQVSEERRKIGTERLLTSMNVVIHVDVVRFSLSIVATNGPIVHPPDDR